ncbi:type IV pilin [Haloplanus sp. GCM10025708]|uniref:type IV pilin n=1 Tax=Haloplanus sp. GCM10025708 TaxID=3252679 RepID=UPI00361E9968
MGGDDRAQSEVVGNVLIVGIVVIGVSVAGAFYLSTIGSEDETFADVEVTLSNTSGPQATFTHQGGDAVDSSSLVVRVTRNGASLSPTLDPDASRVSPTAGSTPATTECTTSPRPDRLRYRTGTRYGRY